MYLDYYVGSLQVNFDDYFFPCCSRPASSSSFSYPKLPQVTVDQEKAQAEVIVPGYSYGDLDRMGK